MDLLEYRALKQKGLIRFDGTTALIDRSEKTVIDKAALELDIKRRKEELDILIDLLTDLP